MSLGAAAIALTGNANLATPIRVGEAVTVGVAGVLRYSTVSSEGTVYSGSSGIFVGIEFAGAPAWMALPPGLRLVGGLPAVAVVAGSFTIPIIASPPASLSGVAAVRLTPLARSAVGGSTVEEIIPPPIGVPAWSARSFSFGYRFTLESTGTGTPTTPVTPTPDPVPDPTSPGGTATNASNLTFLQARFLARRGFKIEREGWRDRYVEYASAHYLLQLYNAVTGVLGARRVINAPDWTREDYLATDFRARGTVPDLVLAEARQVSGGFGI
jgi:hypothetical protein